MQTIHPLTTCNLYTYNTHIIYTTIFPFFANCMLVSRIAHHFSRRISIHPRWPVVVQETEILGSPLYVHIVYR